MIILDEVNGENKFHKATPFQRPREWPLREITPSVFRRVCRAGR